MRNSSAMRIVLAFLLLLIPAGGARASDLLYALVTQDFTGFSVPSWIEIVDPSGFSTVDSFSIGSRGVTSLVVSPDRQSLYVADRANNEVAVYGPTGSLLGSVPVTSPRDLVLSGDGSRLFAATSASIVEIDTGTRTVSDTLPTGSDMMMAISLSRDGGTLAATSTQAGINAALHFVDSATFSLDVRIPITHPTTPVGQVANAAFTDTGRALVWDPALDALYQFDVAAGTQLTSDTILPLATDGGTSVNINNALSYSTLSARAYVHRDVPDELAVFDPSANTVSSLGGFANSPFVSALSPLEDSLFVSVYMTGDTLDVLDTVAGTFTRGVYTFGQHVRDMVVMPAPALHWINASGGAWDVAGNWDPTMTPDATSNVFVDPANGLTVTGPAATSTIRALTIGAQSSGTATLQVQDTGTLHVTGQTTITSDGRLSGDGTFNAAGGIANSGEIDLGTGSLQLVGATLANSGLIRGDGRIDNALSNAADGEVRAETGRRTLFTGAGNTNAGEINLLGGTVEFDLDLTNSASGFIAGRGTLIANGGLSNGGVMAFSGVTDVFGDVTNPGTIVVTGSTTTTFFDDVHSDGTIQVSTGCTAVFFGGLSGASGTQGPGTVQLEGDLRPGNSAAEIAFGGDVVLGTAATVAIELGDGEHDKINVAGAVWLDGVLNLSLIDGFAPSWGDRFEIVTFGSRGGDFDTVNGEELGDGLYFDLVYDAQSLTLATALYGDLSGDGFVGQDDLDIVLTEWGNSPPGDPRADPSGDNFVGQDDLDFVLTFWGQGSLPAPSVPEPATLGIFALCGFALLRRRGRSR